MKKDHTLINKTLQSLLKNGVFLLVIFAVVMACTDSTTEEIATEPTAEIFEPTANFTAKIDGAIMGSVIAPNANIEISATNGEKKITGTTDENGEFFITGFNEGIYTVTITTENTDKLETFQDVEVKRGEVTALGTVDLAVQ